MSDLNNSENEVKANRNSPYYLTFLQVWWWWWFWWFSHTGVHGLQPAWLLCPCSSPGKNTGVGCHSLLQCMEVNSESEVAQSCLTLSDLMDCSLPGSSIHGIFQARVLEWGAIAFSSV